MATVKRFEELVVWQMAEAQCEAFYKLAKEGNFEYQQPLKDQMDRSAASVMDNIAEGFDRFTRADFRHFLIIARGSNAEFRSQLYRAFKRAVIGQQLFESLKTNSEHLGVKLHHFIGYLSQTEFQNKPVDKRLYKKANGRTDEQVKEGEPIYTKSIAFSHTYPEDLLN